MNDRSLCRRKVGLIGHGSHADPPREPNMTMTCFIRDQNDAFRHEAFRRFPEARGRIIQRCGDNLEKVGASGGLSRQVTP
jgi:hypothetical protein